MFDASEYPDLSELRSQFSMRTRYFPIADAGDIRLKVEADVIAAVKEQAEESIKLSLHESMREPYRRLFDAVERVYTQCNNPDSRIHDSLMTNLDHLLEVLPELNFTGDKQLDDLLERCRESISVHPETLRAEPEKKASVAAQAADIMKAMKAFV